MSDTASIGRENTVTEIIITLENREPGQKPLPFYFAPVTLTRWPLYKFMGANKSPREGALAGILAGIGSRCYLMTISVNG
jgi:hypothetical protein